MYYNLPRNHRIVAPTNQYITKHYSPQRYHNLYTSNIFQQPSQQPKQTDSHQTKQYQYQLPKSAPPIYIDNIQLGKQYHPSINKHMIKNQLGWDGIKLVQYVTNNLDKQEYVKDSLMLQRYRSEAEQRKKHKKHHYQMMPQNRFRINYSQNNKSTPIYNQQIQSHNQYIHHDSIRIVNPQQQEQFIVMIPSRKKVLEAQQLTLKLLKTLKKQHIKTNKLKQKYSHLKVRYRHKQLSKFKEQLKYQNKIEKMEKLLKQVQLAVQENKSLTKSKAKTEQDEDHRKYLEYSQNFSTLSKNQFLQQNSSYVKPKVVYTPQLAKQKINVRTKTSNFLQQIKTKRSKMEY